MDLESAKKQEEISFFITPEGKLYPSWQEEKKEGPLSLFRHFFKTDQKEEILKICQKQNNILWMDVTKYEQLSYFMMGREAIYFVPEDITQKQKESLKIASPLLKMFENIHVYQYDGKKQAFYKSEHITGEELYATYFKENRR